MTKDEIKYPAIGLAKDGTVILIKNSLDYSCSKLAAKKNYFLGMTVIDSEGLTFEVLKMTLKEKIKHYWGKSFWTKLTMPTMYSVDIELQSMDKRYSFEEFKDMVLNTYIKKGYFSSVIGEEEIIEEVKRSTNFRELGALLT